MTTSEVNGVADDLVKSTLNHLTEYASYHFCEEEKIMNSIKGFDFSQHFKEHQDFCLKVAELKTKVFLGDNIAYELFDFIKDWVLTHILLTDKKIGDAYNKNR
jgi:hemerythrin